MRRGVASLATICLAIILIGAGYLLGGRNQNGTAVEGTSPQASDEAGPVAQVKTAGVRKGAIEETIHVYGNVIPAPGGTITISVPFECRVHHIMVNEGQEVMRGDPLLQIGPSPDTHLKLNQAAESHDVARQALENMERKFRLKLATNDQVLQAKQAFDTARLNLESMKKQGIDGERELRAEARGVVSKLSVDQGAIVAAGAPLMQLVPGDRLELRLGVEPDDIGKVRTRMPVALSRVLERPAPVIVGTVRKVSRSVNLSTRLVDVFVSVPSGAAFLLGQYVSGAIVVAAAPGLIVPRSAVLPMENDSIVYVVKEGRAVRRGVRPLAESETEISVASPQLLPGDQVIVMGNYELKDNMRVEVGAGR